MTPASAPGLIPRSDELSSDLYWQLSLQGAEVLTDAGPALTLASYFLHFYTMTYPCSLHATIT